MTIFVYVCPKCGKKHSLKEYTEGRFCRHCGKLLTYHDRRTLEETKVKREKLLKWKKNGVELGIEKTYESIRKFILNSNLVDSLEVAKQVEEYRQFWKPKKINVVLLAESHVFTDKQDYEIKCRRPILDKILLPENPNYPVNFVKFIYCLGYGENELLTTEIDSNKQGTWQFWKIFSSCVAENENDLGFSKVLKTRTRFLLRLHNKVDVLRKMKERGIWLLDASIVGLAGSEIKEDQDVCNGIIKICWDNHLENVIKDAQPKHIIVIGKNVDNILHFDLQKLGFSTTVVRQPQGDRRSSQKQQEKYIKCQRICARYS